jgi:hypothetical protein
MKTQIQTTTKSSNQSEKAFKFNTRWRGRKQTIGVLGESFSIVDHKAYQYYKENSKLANRQDVANYVEHGKIISEFYRIAGEKIVEAKGGIFLEGLGYFGIIQEMKKKPTHDRQTGELKFNPKTDNIIYNIAFVPIDKDNILRPWVFDYSFSRKIKKALCNSLKSGKTYSFNASLFFNKLRKTGNDL